MPKISEIRKGIELGREGSHQRYVWLACIDCGKERWVSIQHYSERCHSCANRVIGKTLLGAKNGRWKGGLRYSKGYVFVMQHQHPRADSHGYVKRAILVLEQSLGRPLYPSMDSHHCNGIKDDDRSENLAEKPHAEHRRLHAILEGQRNIPRRQRTHCPNGHEYTPPNTFIDYKGCQRCRICHRENQRRAYLNLGGEKDANKRP